ncbi:MAG: hypothetical protein HYY10_00995 [Candidatus Liptonbacteria bacterium]|nr:hypothetical protein [Candidatus Liptonbacteria bacterium]
MWQDYVIAFGQVVMSASLIPMIFQKGKPTLWTSVPTVVICVTFSFTFATLGLWFSVASSAAGSALWSILAFQRIRRTPS